MTSATVPPRGRELTIAVVLLANTVAVTSLLTGALMAGITISGHLFGAWQSPDPLSQGLVGAAMLGTVPGLFAVNRAQRWEEARTLVLPTAVVLLGLLGVSLGNSGRLHLARGGSLFLVLFSLGWIAVLGLLVLGTLACLGRQYLAARVPVQEPAVPLPGWSKPLLALLGAGWFGIGAGLLADPGSWGGFVPWAADRPDAQALGVWALALGVGILGALAEDDLTRTRPALFALPGVAVTAGLVLAARADRVHWGSGPGRSLLGLLVGLLVAGAVGYRLLWQHDRQAS
ncbi:hypothetical protein [Kitasatospora sp. LaBMicrA B282]|uniref:hypothetical protein n=1 Tax=Kitasatospora sp. LaBMicrA B282 TaxID=3420949 RepID=UPI003D0CB4EB